MPRGEITSSTLRELRVPPSIDWEIDLSFPAETLPKLHKLFHEHGDLYRIVEKRHKTPVYVASHPDMAGLVLGTQHKKYTREATNEHLKFMLGNGLLLSEGELWKAQRKIIQPAFHEKVLSRYSNLMARCNREILSSWQNRSATGQPIDLTKEMLELSLQFNLNTIFGEDADLVLERVGAEFFTQMTEEPKKDVVKNLLFVKQFKTLTQLTTTIIERRRKERKRKKDHAHFDFLSMFLESTHRQSGQVMSNSQIIDEIMSLIMAGHVTVASALKWTWYLISQDSGIEKKLQAEVDQVLAGCTPTLSDLPKLVYVRQVIEEALRLYPPIWIFCRQVSVTRELVGYQVVSGSKIIISPYIIHRHPDFWEQPETFNPDRFSRPAFEKQHNGAFIPFSTGPRTCIGSQLSMWEMLFHISSIAQHLELEFVEGSAITLEPGFVLRSKRKLYMQPKKRQHV